MSMRTLLALVCAAFVAATPGPDSTAVVANAENPESVDLAYYYALKRGIPENQICFLSGLPTTTNADLNMSEYKRLVLMPLQNCLASRNGSLTVDNSKYTRDLGAPGSVLSRIEAFVLMMGMPMRVKTIGNTISIQQCLSAWFISYPNGTLFVETRVSSSSSNMNFPLNAQTYWGPNYLVNGWLPAINSDGCAFYGPWKIVTALNARTFPNAKYLVDQAVLADQLGIAGAKNAQFVWMLAPDGDVRNQLDGQYDGVASQLRSAGFSMIKVNYSVNWVSPTPIAGFICGTSSMSSSGKTLANNYTAHCIMDDLTSYGAAPLNFAPSGCTQVSITKWNTRGCLGSHGTVTEPYTNAFPNRQFMVDYALGNTMSEAYYRYLPFVLWMNYVVGDAMAAPFAVKPLLVVTLDSVMIPTSVPVSPVLSAFNSSNLTASNYRSFASNTLNCTCCLLRVSATSQGTSKTVLSIQVFVDGVLRASNSSSGSTSKSLSLSLPTLNKSASVLVVAQHNSTFREKLWLQRWVQVPAARSCGSG